MSKEWALSVVKARGAWQGAGRGPNLLMFHDGNLRIAYRAPFQELPPPSGALMRKSMELMAYGLRPPQNLPYGLDIWERGNVLNIEWSDNDVHVVSYKAGSWEQDLERLSWGAKRWKRPRSIQKWFG
jgi:hypothetical protein